MNELANGATRIWGAVILLIAMVLVADMAIPLGVAGGVPYVAPVLVSLWLPGRRATMAVVGATTLLTVLGFLYSPPGGELWKVVLNRSYAIFAIWVVAMIGLQRKRLENALRASEERTRKVFEYSNDAIFLVDPTRDEILDTNPMACRMLGYTREELLALPMSAIHPHEMTRLQAFARTVYEAGHGWTNELTCTTKGGEALPAEISASTFEQDGRLLMIAIVRDITEHRRAEEALKESQQWLSTTLRSIGDGVITTDTTGAVTFMNPVAEGLTGWSNDEAAGRPLHDVFNIVNELTGEKMDTPVERILREGVVVGLANHTALVARDGTTRPILDSGAPIATDQGITGTVLVFRDATEQREAQEALRESEERARKIFEYSNDAIFLVDPTRDEILDANPMACGLLGYTRDELVAMPMSAIHPQEMPLLQAFAKTVYETGHGWTNEISCTTKGGEALPAEISASTFELGGRLLMISIVRDITEHRRAEEALRLNAAALEHASNGIVITDTEGTIQWVNPAFTDLTGYESHEVIGKNPRILTSGKQDAAFYQNLWETISSGRAWHGELINRRKDGSLYIEEETITPVLDPAGRITNYVAIKLDVSQRKADEAALRESEERYRTIFTESPVGMSLIDCDLRLVAVNSALCEMLGYSEDELLGKAIGDLTLPEDTAASVDFATRQFTEERTAPQMEMRYVTKDNRVVWARVTGSTVRGDAGQAPYALGIIEDITERKVLQEQLIQAQKMEVVGQLAGGVAHDFNNLLSIILGFSDLAKQAVAGNESAVDYLEQVQNAGQRAATLTNQLLAFSRQQVTQPAVINLNDLMLETDRMLRRLIGENIELVCLLAPEPGDVLIDPGQMEQVLVNMVVNARDAMPGGGKLVIETANVTLNEASARQFADLEPGQYIRLSVKDTGVGMDEEVKSRLFEPFFTTKGPDKGTGLGLATCYGIITQAEGAILVESESGQGSTFDIYLPKVEAENVPEAQVDDSRELPSGTETVLLVEDEPSVRRLGATVLERQGYTVLEAANGEDALRIAEEYGGQRIQLLLTDLVMPQMGGRALANRLCDEFPGIRVLLTSGFPNEGATLGDASGTSVPFLPKPFTPGSLAHQVRRVLDMDVPA